MMGPAHGAFYNNWPKYPLSVLKYARYYEFNEHFGVARQGIPGECDELY